MPLTQIMAHLALLDCVRQEQRPCPLLFVAKGLVHIKKVILRRREATREGGREGKKEGGRIRKGQEVDSTR